jgi:hypothetical protein
MPDHPTNFRKDGGSNPGVMSGQLGCLCARKPMSFISLIGDLRVGR